MRAARAADKHAKMKAALAEQQAKEAAETERRQQQQAHKQAHKERIETWKNKNKVYLPLMDTVTSHSRTSASIVTLS